jgi:hypothetical protein
MEEDVGFRHYYRLKGRTAEAFVNELASKTFLIDWCFPNPRLSNSKELCDLLVVFEHTAIIWQVKNAKLKRDGNLNKKAAEKNLRQLAGARRQIFDVGTPIDLSNARRHPEMLDPATIDEVFLVSVLIGETPDILGVPTEIGQYPCHVLTRDGVEVLLSELDTISDFCAYLREKERAQQNFGEILLVGGERELLAYYLLHERSFAGLEGYDDIAIEEGVWDGLQDRPEYQAKKKADRISYGWDSLINNVHLGGHPNYEKIARELACANRFDRRYLSQAFYDAHLIADQSAEDQMTFRRVGEFKGATYCFLFTGDAISREERRKIMEALCIVARGKYQDNRKVVGIATEMQLRPTCSYDFCLLEIEEWTEEYERQRQEIQDATGLLTNITEHHLEAHEYPEMDS